MTRGGIRLTGRRRENLVAWAFLLPGLIPLVAFLYYPLARAFSFSTSSWNLIGQPRFVGADQYSALIGSDTFRQSLLTTLVFTAATVVFGYAVSLAVALLLDRAVRGIRFVRTVSLLPAIIPMVVAALIWRFIYEPTAGPANQFLEIFGLDGPAWLVDGQFALAAIVVMTVWKDFGIYMLVLLGGLQQIPQSITEAALIDGTTPWQRFWRVTMPMLSASNVFVGILLLFNSIKAFDQIWIMTEGGPGDATLTIVTYLYTRIFTDVGLASAGTVILFVIVLVPLSLQLLARRRAAA